MRTTTLVLTAAISAAALATSMAQIFSVNAVGYVKLTIGANNLALIANPLNQANNNLDLILPLKDDGTQDGVAIYRFDPVTSSYYSAIAWQSIDPTTPGSGGFWFTADGHTNPKIVNPGLGFFIWNITSGPIDM